MRTLLKSLIKDNQGATAVEYGLIAALIVIASISAFNGVASETTALWGEVKTKSADAIAGNSVS